MGNYKVVDVEQLEADLTVVADSIRAKGGTTEKLEFPIGMKSAVESIQTGVTKPEQEKTISITENGTTEVTPDEGKVLSKVTVNVVSGGGSNDFVGVKYSEFDSIRGNPRVADARSLPVDRNDTICGGFPYLFAATSKNANGGWNSMVEDFYLPDGIQGLYNNMFFYTGAIKNIYGDLSNVNIISVACFQFSNIERFDYYCPNLTQIQTNAFDSCAKLIALTLRGSVLVNLLNNNTFKGTPIATGTGYIYVPSALLEDYKVATNWSTYANQFRALENYTVDGTITGALDESKI